MGAKALYTDLSNKIKQQLHLAKDLDAIENLEKDRAEYLKYSADWERINLDDYISQFSVSTDDYNVQANKRKISFFDDGKEYEIVCAIGASYFRVVRKAYVDTNGVLHGNVYVTADLKEPRIPKGLKGVAAKNERNRLTHFRMTYKHKGGK